MIEHELLKQLSAFAKYGTLSKCAEKLHISQPTLTRSMQKLEDAFGVPLFLRTKNHMEFNENGKLAADYAERILALTDQMVERVRDLDHASHTISIGSCASARTPLCRKQRHLYGRNGRRKHASLLQYRILAQPSPGKDAPCLSERGISESPETVFMILTSRHFLFS